MSITQPEFLHVMNGSSGTAIIQYGTKAGNYIVAQGVENTNWSWHQGLGPYASNGYLQFQTALPNAAMGYCATTFTAPSSVGEDANMAIGFRVTAIYSGAVRLVAPFNSPNDGNFTFEGLTPPSAGGDFDLAMRIRNTGAQEIAATLITGLSFGVDYIACASIDYSTPSAAQARFKLSGNAVDAPATANWTSSQLEAGWPRICRRQDFTNYYGMQGRVNFFAHQRGAGIRWDSADLTSITTNPATALVGWPGAAASPGPLLFRRSQHFVNDVIYQA